MPIINPDTTQAKDFSPLDPGTYQAKIVAVESKKSKKNNPMIVPTLAITVPGRTDAREKQAFLVITGEGAYGFDQLLRSAGFADIADKYRDPSVSPKPPFDTDALIGRSVQVVIETQMYDKGDGSGAKPTDAIKTFLPS